MKQLSNFIIESTTNGGFISVLSRDGAKNVLSGKGLDEFIDLIYDYWETAVQYDKYPPFRTDGKDIKIARCYETNEFFKRLDDASIKYKNTPGAAIKINNYRFIWGNGSPAGRTSSQAGLEYEKTVLDNIKSVISNLAAGMDPKKVFTDGKENLKPIYDARDLDDAIAYIKKNQMDIHDIVLPTGKINTTRNKSGQIFDKDLNLNTANKRKTVKDSGRIIADIQITVPGKEPVNISVKLGHAQLSALQVTDVMQSNAGFRSALEKKRSYADIKDEPYMVKFNNAFKLMGINPEDIYNWYLNDTGTAAKFESYDSDLLGDLFSYILGGDYWYVTPNPADVIYVPWDRDYDVKVDTNTPAEISATGKQIKVAVKIPGAKKTPHVVFRCDQGGYQYPVRFFFDNIHVSDLI